MSYKLTAREMRNAEHQIKAKGQLEEILQNENLCRIALCDDGEPYLIPMNYGYKDGSLYLHCAMEGRKLDIIRKNNLVCFEVESGVTGPPIHYKCVVGVGRVHILDEENEVDQALDILCSHFDEKYRDWRQQCGPKVREETIALRVDILEMTGKHRRYDDWAESDHSH